MENILGVGCIALIALSAAACTNKNRSSDNDGGGDSAGNRAPVFTSAASASVPEGATGVIYTAAASDPDGDPLTAFSLSGFADQAAFSLTPAGALSFNQTPNFERPRDLNLNNTYQVEITVGDGAATARLSLVITVTDGPEAYRLRRIATGLSAPIFLTGRPGGADVFVVERAGRVRLLDPATGVAAATPFLDISVDVGTTGEGGLLGFAPAPDYAASGVFYVHLTNTLGNTEIRRYVRSGGNPNVADPASGDVILTAAQPAANHNGGWIGFGPDGFLYIALGDGGGSGDMFGNAQNTNTILGAMLRIDPSFDAFPADAARDYAIPAGNPFAGGGGAPEIWAYGLRNPFQASFDSANGNLYIGDVGQAAIEEIDLIPSGVAGLNFGWNLREGTQSFAGADSPSFTPPVTQYPHGVAGPREGNTVIGGVVYRGPVSALAGRYFFADFISDNIWSIPAAEFSQGTTLPVSDFILETGPLTPDAGVLSSVVGFGEDNARNLYIVSMNGDIFMIEAAP